MEASINIPKISSTRISSIDLVRGLVVVIMALDHTRDLIYTNAFGHDPLDLNTTTPALFATRWITHLCAPIFVFLAGTSVFLSLRQSGDLIKTASFVRKRGLLLILLELTIINFGFWADIQYRTILLQVIFAIGACFFILSFMLRLKARVLGAIGLGIIFLHDLGSGLQFEDNVFVKFIYSLFLDSGFFKPAGDRVFVIGYSVIPWLGIMLFGFSFGEVFLFEKTKRKKALLFFSLGAFVLFFVLRFLNVYGDPVPWTKQQSGLYTVLSFIKLGKYPPSLLYTALMLSIMFLVLYLSDEKEGPLARFFLTYGKVPMFFYILHWYVIHVGMFVLLFFQGYGWDDFYFGPFGCGRPQGGGGLSLGYMYVYWISVIAVMYPLCKWYGRYKAAHHEIKWLKYF